MPTMRACVIESHGPDEKCMQFKEVEMPPLKSRQVRIAMRACSLNLHDIFTRQGMPGVRTPLPMVLGCDCAGVIAEMAPDCKGDWKLGDRILCEPISRFKNSGRKRGEGGPDSWTNGAVDDDEDPEPELKMKMIGDTRWGGYADYVVVWDRQLIKLPDNVSFEEAGCLPIAFGSAYRQMMVKAKVQPGEKVLVLGASGGVGNCCVQLAKSAGATVVGCCGSDQGCEDLKKNFGVEAWNTSKDDLVKKTREFTGGSLIAGGGFDVVVNSQGGAQGYDAQSLKNNWWQIGLKCAKAGGRVTLLGATAGYDPPTDLRYIWTGELTILGSNGWETPDLHSLLELLQSGKLKPSIGATFPLEKCIEAHMALEHRKYFGKIVLTGNAPILGSSPSKL